MTQKVRTAKAPRPIGPYSQAVKAGRLVFVSGQLGLDPASAKLRRGVEAQARQAVRNVGAILGEAGCSWREVVKVTLFLAEMSDFERVNMVYASEIGDAAPARSTVAVRALPKGALVELDAVAYVP
jgi:2-iminobutanoate/2-iminopropanoate deaminase